MKERFILEIPNFIKVIKHLLMSLAVALMPYKAAADIKVFGGEVEEPGSALHRSVLALTTRSYLGTYSGSAVFHGDNKISTAAHMYINSYAWAKYVDTIDGIPVYYPFPQFESYALSSNNTITTAISSDSLTLNIKAVIPNPNYKLNAIPEVNNNDSAFACIEPNTNNFLKPAILMFGDIPNSDRYFIAGYGLTDSPNRAPGILTSGSFDKFAYTAQGMAHIQSNNPNVRSEGGDSGGYFGIVDPRTGKVYHLGNISGNNDNGTFVARLSDTFQKIDCSRILNAIIPDEQRSKGDIKYTIRRVPNNAASEIGVSYAHQSGTRPKTVATTISLISNTKGCFTLVYGRVEPIYRQIPNPQLTTHLDPDDIEIYSFTTGEVAPEELDANFQVYRIKEPKCAKAEMYISTTDLRAQVKDEVDPNILRDIQRPEAQSYLVVGNKWPVYLSFIGR